VAVHGQLAPRRGSLQRVENILRQARAQQGQGDQHDKVLLPIIKDDCAETG
jgi:hypothetical protein